MLKAPQKIRSNEQILRCEIETNSGAFFQKSKAKEKDSLK